jgi:CPA2 family monovalent cation:H+ antiporter-2
MTLARVAVFIALMLVIGKRVLPWLLWQVAKTGSRELFTLCVLAVAIGIAFGAAEVFQVSFALGAFFAGMVMRESKYSHRAAIESLPLRDAFSVIFFVGVGMMFDPMIIVEQPLHVLAVLFIILVGKSLAAFGLVMLMRYPLHTALTTSAALAQIGEFSFILAGLGITLGLLPKDGMSLVLAGAIFSIALNPLAFAAIPFAREKLRQKWKYARVLDARPDPQSIMPDATAKEFLEGHIVVVGAGTVGTMVIEGLAERKINIVAIDRNTEAADRLRAQKLQTIQGEASDPAILIQAHVQDCAMLMLTIHDDITQRRIIETARLLNPDVEVVMLEDRREEADHAASDKLGRVFYGPGIVALELVRYAMERFGRKEEEARIEEDKATDAAEKAAH